MYSKLLFTVVAFARYTAENPKQPERADLIQRSIAIAGSSKILGRCLTEFCFLVAVPHLVNKAHTKEVILAAPVSEISL